MVTTRQAASLAALRYRAQRPSWRRSLLGRFPLLVRAYIRSRGSTRVPRQRGLTVRRFRRVTVSNSFIDDPHLLTLLFIGVIGG